jgi:hypothetical protein
MIRRLNFTGRRRIPRSQVLVRLLPGALGTWTFDAHFSLAGLDLPADASVFIEAYNVTSYMRFDFGTVEELAIPEDRTLSEITASPLPKFRLKVVDRRRRHGQLLAVADKLIPLRSDEDLEQRQSLLPVEFHDLGDRIWRLDVSDWPVLQLNRRIADLGEIARSADWFLGLVYPEVVRRILHTIVLDLGETDPDLDESEWTCLWLRYVGAFPGVGKPPAGDNEGARQRQLQWIDDAVQAFSRAREARVRFEKAIARGGAG